jgi:hypothetical protein
MIFWSFTIFLACASGIEEFSYGGYSSYEDAVRNANRLSMENELIYDVVKGNIPVYMDTSNCEFVTITYDKYEP